MMPKRHENKNAESKWRFTELWSRRPLSGWVKSSSNKKLSRRIERHTSKIESEQDNE